MATILTAMFGRKEDRNGLVTKAPKTNAVEMPTYEPTVEIEVANSATRRAGAYASEASRRLGGSVVVPRRNFRVIVPVVIVTYIALTVIFSVDGSVFESTGDTLEDRDSTAESAAPEQPNEWTNHEADGVSNIPGESVVVNYDVGQGFNEASYDANNGAGEHDGATWGLAAGPSADGDDLVITHLMYEPQISTQQALRRAVASWNNRNEYSAGRALRPRKTTFDGHTAYRWKYTASDEMTYVIWLIPGVVHSYWIRCRLTDSSARELWRLCENPASTTRFNIPPEPIPGGNLN